MTMENPAAGLAEPSQRPPSVSVLIPARDSEAIIGAALDSVLAQEYAGAIEVVVADGSDRPEMANLIRRSYPDVRLVPNPGKRAPSGLNAALRVATGEIVIRCDARSRLPAGYVSRAVETLLRTGAAAVGACQEPIGTTFFERAVALAMSTPLGAGTARYRRGGPEGPVDTFYLGTFRRETLNEVGGYGPTTLGSEDAELNWRLRERGGTLWLDPELRVAYKPRSSLRRLARLYFNYGQLKRGVLRIHPLSLRPRQAAPPLLVLSLGASALGALAGTPWAAAIPVAYAGGLVLGSLAVAVRRRDPVAVILPLVMMTMHLSWGIGFLLPGQPKPYN